MTLNEYQEAALNVSKWAPGGEKSMAYYALKLNGEAGETAELVGKAWRGDYTVFPPAPESVRDVFLDKPELRNKLVKELGDVLWYVSKIAAQADVTLDEVAATNIAKLQARVDNVNAGLPAKSGAGA